VAAGAGAGAGAVAGAGPLLQWLRGIPAIANPETIGRKLSLLGVQDPLGILQLQRADVKGLEMDKPARNAMRAGLEALQAAAGAGTGGQPAGGGRGAAVGTATGAAAAAAVSSASVRADAGLEYHQQLLMKFGFAKRELEGASDHACWKALNWHMYLRYCIDICGGCMLKRNLRWQQCVREAVWVAHEGLRVSDLAMEVAGLEVECRLTVVAKARLDRMFEDRAGWPSHFWLSKVQQACCAFLPDSSENSKVWTAIWQFLRRPSPFPLCADWCDWSALAGCVQKSGPSQIHVVY
jgi:hypothetical protein